MRFIWSRLLGDIFEENLEALTHYTGLSYQSDIVAEPEMKP